jgi:hypothetical protein
MFLAAVNDAVSLQASVKPKVVIRRMGNEFPGSKPSKR